MRGSYSITQKDSIETVVDRLEEYVKSRKEVSLKDAAKALALSMNQAERLALLLEESGRIQVNYALVGVMLSEKVERDENTREVILKKDIVMEESASLEREVMASESMMKFFEKDITRRVILAERMIEDLRAREGGLSEEELKYLRSEVQLAANQLSAFSKEIDALKSKETEFKAKLDSFSKELDGVKASAAPRQAVSLDYALVKLRLMLESIMRLISGGNKFVLEERKNSAVAVPVVTSAPTAKLPQPISVPAVSVRKAPEKPLLGMPRVVDLTKPAPAVEYRKPPSPTPSRSNKKTKKVRGK